MVTAGSGRALVPAAAARELRRELLSQVAGQVGEGVAVFDLEDRVVYANPALAALHGCQPDDLVGHHLSTFVGPPGGPVDGPPGGEAARAQAEGAGDGVLRAEIESRRLDGSPLDVDVTVSSLRNDAGERIGRIVCVHDVTARKELQRQLQRASLHDPLTDLPNRRLLADRLEHALVRAEADASMVAVLFIDLDGFKAVNDAHGHDAGDQLLVQTAARLRGCLRAGDTLARLGGDEFVLLLEDVTDADQPTRTVQRVVATLAQPFDLGGTPVRISASIGVALSATGSQRSLLHAADSAMYEAKATGRGRIVASRWEAHASRSVPAAP